MGRQIGRDETFSAILLESSVYDRRRTPHPLPALWHRNGHARPRAGHAVDTGPVLGLSPLRPTLLDDLSSAESRESQAGPGAQLVILATRGANPSAFERRATPVFDLDDEVDDEDLDDDDDDEDEEDGQKGDEEDEDEEEDDDEGDEDEPETWQVVGRSFP